MVVRVVVMVVILSGLKAVTMDEDDPAELKSSWM